MRLKYIQKGEPFALHKQWFFFRLGGFLRIMIKNEQQQIILMLCNLKAGLDKLSLLINQTIDAVKQTPDIQTLSSKLRYFTQKSNKLLTDSLIALDYLDAGLTFPFSRDYDMYDSAEESLCDVEVKITSDRSIIFRFPHLPGKSSRPNRSKKALKVRYRIGPALLREAERSKRPIPVFTKFRLAFVHVFPSTCCSRLIKDNDNYDYKYCIDAITDALAVSDDALRCQLSMSTVISDNIKSGTYCIVS